MPKKPNQKVTVTLTTDQTIVALLAIEFQRDEVVSLKYADWRRHLANLSEAHEALSAALPPVVR